MFIYFELAYLLTGCSEWGKRNFKPYKRYIYECQRLLDVGYLQERLKVAEVLPKILLGERHQTMVHFAAKPSLQDSKNKRLCLRQIEKLYNHIQIKAKEIFVSS